MDTLAILTNPEFTLQYKGQDYLVRKATIRQVVAYKERIKSLQRQDGADEKIAAHCVYLLLKDKIPDLIEDDVLDNMHGDMDVLELLGKLGFINPEKLEMIKRLQEIVKPTGLKSSPSSATELDGLPTKSEDSPSRS